MTGSTTTVPLSHAPNGGTVGHSASSAGRERDSGGTIGLKALAARVLHRDTVRDSAGTAPPKPCPVNAGPVGQSPVPVPDVAISEFQAVETPLAAPRPDEDAGRAADELEERAAIVEHWAGVPRSWAEGYAALSTMPPPAGFAPERWQRVVDAAGGFIDQWAAEATRCGWSDMDVFGCHPTRPDARFDAMGLVLLLDRCDVVGVDEDGADLVTVTGARQRYRRRPLPPGTVSLWELATR